MLLTFSWWVLQGFPLFLLQVSGSTILFCLGVRRPSVLAFTAIIPSVLFGAVLLWLLGALGAPHLFQAIFFCVLGLSFLGGLVRYRLEKEYLVGILIGGLTALAAWLIKITLQVGERASEDSLQIVVYATDYLQRGLQPPIYDRGLALPILLSLGPAGHILIGVPLLIWLNFLGIAILVALQFSGNELKSANNLLAAVATICVFVSLPITFISATYINSHTLVGLCVGVTAYVLARGAKNFSLQNNERTLLLLALACWTLARPDGILFVFFVLIFFMSLTLDSAEESRLWLLVALLVAAILASVIIKPPAFLEAAGGFTSLAFFCVVAVVAWLLRRSITPQLISFFALVVASTVVVLFLLQADIGLVGSLSPQLRNLALGAGGWGLYFPLLILLMLVSQLPKRGHQIASLLHLAFGLTLTLVALKVLSGGGIGNQGFNDSVNRSLLHLVPLFLPITYSAFEVVFARLRGGIRAIGRSGYV